MKDNPTFMLVIVAIFVAVVALLIYRGAKATPRSLTPKSKPTQPSPEAQRFSASEEAQTNTPSAFPPKVAATYSPASSPDATATKLRQNSEKISQQNNIGEAPGLTIVKRLLRESSGARDFLRRAVSAGFRPTDEDWMGVHMEGHGCKIIFDVLASKGPDRIWSLAFKAGEESSRTLVSEGVNNF